MALWGLLFLHLALSPLVFSLATLEPFDYPKSLLLQLVGMLALAWMTVAASSGAKAPATSFVARVAGDPLAAGVLLFGASAVLSTAFSISTRTSLAGAPESFAGLPTLLAGVALFFATRSACGSWLDGRALLVAPVIGATGAAGYALVQALGFDAFAWNRVAEREFLPALDTSLSLGTTRVFGSFGNANTLSAYLAAVLPIEMCLALHSRRRGRPLLAGVFGAAALIGALAILRSASRAGWLGLGLAVTGVLALRFVASGRRVSRKTGFGVLAAAIAALALALTPTGRDLLDALGQRLLGATGAGSRRFLWSAAFDLFLDHPLTGTGVDTFGLAFTPRRTPESWAVEWNTTFVRAHNEMLQVLATQGLVGVLAGLVMLWGLGCSARAAWRNVADRERLLLGSLFVAILCLVPQASFGLLQVAPAVLLITLAALISVAARGTEAKTRPEPGRTWRLSTAAASLAPCILLWNAAAWRGNGVSGLFTLAAFTAPLLVLLVIRRATPVAPRRASRAPAGPSVGAYLAASAIACALAASLLYPAAAASAAAAMAARLAATDPEAALRSYRRAVSLDPRHAPHWSRLGQATQAAAARLPRAAGTALRRQAGGALARAGALEPLDGQYQMLFCRATAEQALAGEAAAAEAFAACDRAIAIERANPYFHTAAVNAAVQLGDLPRARRLVEAGLALYPRLGPLEYQLGFIAAQEGRLDDAARILSAAVQDEWHGQEAGREAARKALDIVRNRLTQPAPAEVRR